ncbi:alpha/beta-hydrolase [Sarocladium strictum]
MGLRNASVLFAAAFASQCVTARSLPTADVQPRTFDLGHNDWSCQSPKGQNPVVLLHGLGATFYEDINFLESWLQRQGLCTFSLTYGAYPGFPFVGGLRPIEESSREIVDFTRKVQDATGSEKVDLVGHSEGALQTLYTTKFGGISESIGRVVAIAPPTHGTSFANLYTIAQTIGIDGLADSVLSIFGCKACTELVNGGTAIQQLNDGPITQPGVQYTIITSKNDELVSPPDTSFIDEPGVTNIYVQDYCPSDAVGHIGEGYDPNVWHLVLNALEGEIGREFECSIGIPLR